MGQLSAAYLTLSLPSRGEHLYLFQAAMCQSQVTAMG